MLTVFWKPVVYLWLCVVLAFACSSSSSIDDSRVGPGGGSDTSTGADTGASGGKGGSSGFGGNEFTPMDSNLVDASSSVDATYVDEDGGTEVCVQDNAEATLELRPIDIIFAIDTSGSMDAEIQGVQDNINNNFANIIGMSGIDYRVILISNSDVCISGALNPNGCGQSNPPTYNWVDAKVGSNDAWCVMLNTYPQWSGYLRQEAFKVFVVITDDSPFCSEVLLGPLYTADQTGADMFDSALLALDPVQFGTATDRNYIFHSLVALAVNNPSTAAYQPTDPVITATCPTAANNGTGYQELSQMTGGLRFPVCEGSNFDTVFQTIATGIVDGAAVACEFVIPDTGASGKPVVRDTVEVAYVPGDKSATIKFDHVDTVADCATQAFYLDGDMVRLCPAACDAIKQDPGAEVQVLFGCDVCGGLDTSCSVVPPPTLPPPVLK